MNTNCQTGSPAELTHTERVLTGITNNKQITLELLRRLVTIKDKLLGTDLTTEKMQEAPTPPDGFIVLSLSELQAQLELLGNLESVIRQLETL